LVGALLLKKKQVLARKVLTIAYSSDWLGSSKPMKERKKVLLWSWEYFAISVRDPNTQAIVPLLKALMRRPGRTNFGPAQTRSQEGLHLVVNSVSSWICSKRKRRGSV